MTVTCRIVVSVLISGTLVAVVPGTGTAVAAATAVTGDAPQTPTAGDAREKLLDEVASLNEDLVEFALAGNIAKINETANAIGASLSKLKAAVGTRTFAAVEARVRDQRTAIDAGNHTATALASVEIYRLLQDAMNPTARPVPLPVPLLDYAGFKLLALAKADAVDWGIIDATANEAASFWSDVEQRIDSVALRNLLDSIMTGLHDASSARNPAFTAFAAQVLLESVDLLEGQFIRK